MNTKLTLNMDDAIIEQAKGYARQRKMSLSRLAETFFKSLVTDERGMEYRPIVKELSGIIALKVDEDSKDTYAEYLIGKYR